ncbi:MAG: hypothetical protein U0556_05340 [Dehalococcoidia bacterium]
MDEMFVPEATEEAPAAQPPESALELVDRIGPEESRTLLTAAVREFLVEDQREVWRRRRERLIHFLNILDYNLDYDLRVRGLAS